MILATRVIVAVPLPVLQDRDIKFMPALPEEKITAAKALQMDSAVKACLLHIICACISSCDYLLETLCIYQTKTKKFPC